MDDDAQRLHIAEGMPSSLSGRRARRISKEISIIGARPISADRVKQLWSGATPTKDEAASLRAWTELCVRDIQRLGNQNDRLRLTRRRVAIAALCLWVVAVTPYLATHIGSILSQLSGA